MNPNTKKFTIIPPVITSNRYYMDNPVRVTVGSCLQKRKAVYQMAVYFRREFGYDFVQYGYEGDEDDIKHVAFLWIPLDHHCSVYGNVPCVGATCFRWREWSNIPHGWAMQWIWMHPYFRGKGLLKSAWPKFKEEFGEFICEPPLSPAMELFLKKYAKSQWEFLCEQG